MEFFGRVKKLMAVRSGVSRVGNAWKAQDFIFEYFENDIDQYAESVLLNVRGDKIDELNLQEGEEIKVDIRHTVRAYGDRLYNEVYARNIEKVTNGAGQQPASQQTEQTAKQPSTTQKPTAEQQEAMEKLNAMAEKAASGEDSDDDMPF